MTLPFVPRSTLAATETMLAEMRQINAGLQARFDDLLRSYMALRREGFVVPSPVSFDDEAPEPVSVDDADQAAAERQSQTVAD